MDSLPPALQVPANQASPKKGLPPMAWLGIGCGGLLIVAMLSTALLIGWGKRKVREGQETLAEVEMELRVLAEADAQAELDRVLRDSEKKGEELSDRPGDGDPSDIPAWVPRYPSGEDEQVFFRDAVEGGVEGSFYFNTSDSPQELEDFYEEQTDSFPTRTSRTKEKDAEKRRMLEYEGGGKTFEVILVMKDSSKDTLVIVNYEEVAPKKP